MCLVFDLSLSLVISSLKRYSFFCSDSSEYYTTAVDTVIVFGVIILQFSKWELIKAT